MSKAKLFQKSILDFYVEKQDLNLINERWIKFQVFLKKKEKIKTWIETDYQVGFLEDIFENCLGYISKTQSPDEHFTLDREKKNEGNAQKADGALIVDTKVIAVIELKDQKTENLDKKYSREESAVRQAFGYLNNQPSAKYVIVSNFNELRFYFQKADKYEKFMLFDLDFEGFKKLHTLLSYESISKGIPYEIKKKSINFEEEISDNLYKDYTKFRTKLFENIVKNNLTIDKVKLLALTQKLIDRIIFILFAEDTQILPLNTIQSIITNHDKNIINDSSLYDFYKIYFQAIDKGNRKLNISAYNGGLFAKDNLLDSLIIDDNVLDEQAKVLSAYNFGSDISVNILGHIFEKSITALEEITSQIQDDTYDKKKSQQKIDGAFYTPEYITKYILENTLGKLCEKKRTELNLNDIEIPLKIGKLTKKEKQVLEDIYSYREWLLNIKIVDPACGSGAFLNQALEFLLNEHKFIDNNRRLYENEGLSLYDIKSNILKNNLYGVDINEGAVEIAKLSLWLRTATDGEPLTKLAEKIKVGNSLISGKNIVNNAFDWKKEFPEVFAQGGFDVVIGNPPYINARNMKKQERNEISLGYPILTGAYDIYLPFLLLGKSIIKNNGVYGWIIPNKLLISDYAKTSLEFLKSNSLYSVINISQLPIFKNVGVYPIILIGENNTEMKFVEYEINDITNLNCIEKYKKKKNIFNRFKTLKDYNILINSGTTGFEAQKIIPLINEDKIGIKFVVSGTIDPYLLKQQNVPYMKKIYNSPFIQYDENIIAKSKFNFWNKDKIVIAGMTKRIEAIYSDEPLALGVGIYGIYDFSKFNPKFLLAILNSKFLTYYLNTVFKDKHLAGGYLAINKSTIEQLPIVYTQNQEELAIHADKMMFLNSELQKVKQNFMKMLELLKIPKKLQNFEELEFDGFIKEYKKAKKLKFDTKIEERKLRTEWEELFENDKKDALDLKSQIDRTNEEIDTMVYRLYGLSPDEIQIVEDAT